MIRTKIELLKGADSVVPPPFFVKEAGLTRRIAVIQDSYRPDLVDMYFDEPLWLRLLEFGLEFGRDREVRIVEVERPVSRFAQLRRLWKRGAAQGSDRTDGVRPEAFLAQWNELNDPDRDPPAFIIVRDGENLLLCIVTEYWSRCGGPMPYHDSYTYSIYANVDLGSAAAKFLMEAECALGWEISGDYSHS